MVHKKSSANAGCQRDDEGEYRPCYFCLEGWVFIGSVGHDGEEVIEYIRCRRCKGKGRLKRL